MVSCVGGADKHTIGCSILHMCGLVNVCLCAAVRVLACRCCNIHSSAPHARDWLPVAGPQALAAPAGWLGSGTGCRTDLTALYCPAQACLGLQCTGRFAGGEVRPKGTGMARSPVRFWVPSGPVGLLLSRCTKGRQVGASVKLCWPCG